MSIVRSVCIVCVVSVSVSSFVLNFMYETSCLVRGLCVCVCVGESLVFYWDEFSKPTVLLLQTMIEVTPLCALLLGYVGRDSCNLPANNLSFQQ